jgi:uncharacterized protein YgiM (DUF1202 family)
MTKYLVLIILFVLISPVSRGEQDLKGKVIATKLNVRILPETRYSVIANLKKDDEVTVLKKEGEWLQIKAPDNSSVWIAGTFVKADGTVSRKVNMRGGPSVSYQSYGTLSPGVKVDILGKSRGNWLKIAPPVELKGWVNARYVKLPTVKKAAPENAEKKTSTIEAEKLKYQELKNSGGLPFVKGDEKSVAVEGILLPLSTDSTYVTHALATKVKNEYFPICYIHSKKLNLKLWVKRKIRVKGTQRWVKGWKRPVVEVERITPMWD